jgi:hypothetical protein
MTAPAGWHPDPQDDSQWRYWDGSSWTEHRAVRRTVEQQAKPSNGLSAAGLVCGLCAVLIIPLLLGGAGVVLSALAIGRKEQLGILALVLSLTGMLIGIYLGAQAATGSL